jgi:hypothetical protein
MEKLAKLKKQAVAKMDKAKKNGDMKTYNEMILYIQEIEKAEENLMDGII